MSLFVGHTVQRRALHSYLTSSLPCVRPDRNSSTSQSSSRSSSSASPLDKSHSLDISSTRGVQRGTGYEQGESRKLIHGLYLLSI